MRAFAPLAAVLLALACSKPAATPAADSSMGAMHDTTAMAPAAAAPVPDAPVWAVVVLYNWP
ncbi:MAG TPA: hypothetical protein VK617_13410, partial [Gemmatimonadaceae bacterium]|nr:hypothetical protein [Gemmatimonadaceae bacterium]